MREQRILVELGFHVPMAIAPGAAAKEHPRRLTRRAVVHRPGEGLWVRGIDQKVDGGRLACVLLPFDHGAFLRGKIGRVAGVVGYPREDREAQMDADDRVRMRMPKPRTQERACIAALRDESLIAQFPHQPDPHVGRFDIADTVPGQRPREGEPWQRRDDDVEGVLRIAAMCSRIGQGHDDVLEVPERPGPSVVENDGNGVGALAAHMNEMDRHAVDLCTELREAVDPRFLRAPVETVLPIGHQLAQVGAVDSVGPVLVVKFGRPARVGQARAKRVYLALRNVDPEWLNLHHDYPSNAVKMVVLQKVVGDRKRFGKGISYAATPKILAMNFTRSLTAPFSTFSICPFFIMCIVS